jgi:hypothetical protein
MGHWLRINWEEMGRIFFGHPQGFRRELAFVTFRPELASAHKHVATRIDSE